MKKTTVADWDAPGLGWPSRLDGQGATELMQVMARACGHRHVNEFSLDDLTTWKREMSHLTGISYGGVSLE